MVTDPPPRRERRNLWATCAAQFLALAGMTAVLPLLPLYLQHIGVTDRATLKYWTGVLGAAPFAVAVFATPVWGALADRLGYKPMVVRSVFGIALSTVGMGLSSSPLALLGWRAVQGAVSGVFPAAVALVSALTPEARVGRSLALLQSARAGGALCGPLIGGVLADLVGIRGLFFGVGLLAAAAGLACAVLIEEPPRHPAHPAAATDAPSWRALLTARPLLGMLLLLTLFQAAVMCSWPTLALYVEQLGVERASVATTTGVVVFAAGLPSMLMATAWSRWGRRVGPLPALTASLLLSGAANLAMAAAAGLPMVLALRASAGAGVAGFIPLTFEWMNARASAGARPHGRARLDGDDGRQRHRSADGRLARRPRRPRRDLLGAGGDARRGRRDARPGPHPPVPRLSAVTQPRRLRYTGGAGPDPARRRRMKPISAILLATLCWAGAVVAQGRRRARRTSNGSAPGCRSAAAGWCSACDSTPRSCRRSARRPWCARAAAGAGRRAALRG
ncbi:MAG: MFS transporter [Candidatus Binatia bacterium]